MMNTLGVQPSGSRNSIGSFVMRLLVAAALTAATGALGNTAYELLFDPQAYAAGAVLARAAFAFAFPFPFILAGLLVVGVPVAYALRRVRLESGIVFGIAGAVAGGLIGVATANGLLHLQVVFAAYGCVSAVAFWALRLRRA